MKKSRLQEKLADYTNALNRLEESTKINIDNSIIIDGVIQRFEFTFELSWKLMKSFLEYQGIEETKSPRITIKEAFKFGLIENGDDWIDMMIDRNKTSHIYDEEAAKEIYDKIKSNHINLLKSLLCKIKKLI